MANRFGTPIGFTMEKNVVQLFAMVQFGANGVPILNTNQSKGFCNAAISAPVFTGSIGSGSATITSVSSFQGLFTGMTVTGTGVGASLTIGTMTAATGSIVLSAAASVTAGSISFTATGGQYTLQLGTQAGVRLDSYNALLDYNYSFDESTGSASGKALVLQLAPAAQNSFIVTNNTSIRTIPATSTSNSTDCTLTVQFGNGFGSGFVAAAPASGEVVRFNLGMRNSSAI